MVNNRWARLSQSEKAELLGIYTAHGYNDLAEIISHYNTYADGGPYGVIPLGGDYLTYLQTMPEVSGGMIEPSVVTAALPAKFNGSQAAAQRYAEGYLQGSKPISEAMNQAGINVFRAADAVAGFVPGPIGMVDWLGHMGADAAEGKWGKVGRDVALAAALGAGAKGIGWLRNYIDDATNFGEDIFRAFTDPVPGKVSTNFTYSAPAARASMETVPVVEGAVSAPYEIENLGGGYMLKSLMRGNKLESKLSKDGLIKTDVIRGYANQSGGVQKAVMDKILASNEFAGKKSIDYNKFRKAVQDELITYERTPDTRYNDYGVSSLGLKQSEDLSHLRNIEDFARSDRFEVVSTDTIGQARLWLDKTTGDILNWDGVTQRYLGEHDVLNAGPGLNTFTFSSSRIPQGSDRHYDSNTLGHSRTYTTSGEPDVLHVMESQSDWAQQGVALDRSKKIAKAEERYPGGFEARRDKAIGDAKKDVETWKRIIETGVAGDGRKLEAWEIENIRTDLLYNAERRLRELEATYSYVDPQELYLSDNFAPRQIQENLRYAAEKGQKKMRYPTRDTAAKIEGYSEGTMYFDANGNDVTKTGQSVTALPEEWQKKYDDIENKIRALTEKDEEYGSIAFKRHENDKTTWITQKTYGDVIDLSTQQREILENHSELRPGITRKKIWTANGDQKTAEMILQKYDAFPKQFRKLYKNADVRTVTDPKGNTWYEVDVPEEYLKQEWAYENGGYLLGNGGKIHIKPENRGKFTALKKRTGHSASWFKEHGTPAQKKMAVFALNARKWKHADGGPLAITSQYIQDPQAKSRIETVRLPDLNINMPEAKVQTPIAFDLAPEIYNMVPLMYDIPTVTVPFGDEKEIDYFSKEALERRALKQRYAESGFRNNAVSGAGAQGAYQIMPITYKDYLGRGKGKAGDLNDPEYNRKIRDWVMGIIPRDLGEFYSENDAPLVRLAKIYGAYNWGAGNMRRYLRKQRDAGIDIANDTSWVEGLNPETKRYIKYLAFDEDIPDSTYTNDAFVDAAMKKGFLKYGGKIKKSVNFCDISSIF